MHIHRLRTSVVQTWRILLIAMEAVSSRCSSMVELLLPCTKFFLPERGGRSAGMNGSSVIQVKQGEGGRRLLINISSKLLKWARWTKGQRSPLFQKGRMWANSHDPQRSGKIPQQPGTLDAQRSVGILLCPFFFGGDRGRKMLGAKPRVMYLLSRCSVLWPQPPAFLLGLFPHLTALWEFIVFNFSVNSGVIIVVLCFSSPLFPVGRQRLWMNTLLLHQAFLLSSSC